MTSRGPGSDEWGAGDEAPRDPVGPYTLAYFTACLAAVVVTIAVTYSSLHVLSVRMSAARVIALEQSQVLDLQHLGRTAVDLSGAPVTVVLPRANVRAVDSVCSPVW